MLRIGLTGGIASGKSTVAFLLREADCLVLEADPLGHEMLEPGQASYDEIVREFGEEILDADEKVDRAKLGAIVFADSAKRTRLNQILHPRILEVVRKWFTALERPGGPDFAFVEAALILEAGFQKEFGRIIVCWCRPEQQIERLLERGLSPEQAQLRIAAQMPIDEKRGMADYVIDCSGLVEDTARQVAHVVEQLRQSGAKERNLS
jgi:dephospho-CoA kinase